MDFRQLKEAIKTKVDLVDLVAESVRLRRSGRSMKGLCPFHDEKTASFHVFPDSQTFRCFGCSKGGDVFTWVMETERIEFLEALRLLAERCGLPMPERLGSGKEKAGPGKREYLEVLSLAQGFFLENLSAPEAVEAREYVEARGLEGVRSDFGLGFAPGPKEIGGRRRWPLAGFFASRRVPPALGVEVGLLGRTRTGEVFDRFRNRLMFPIHDERGRIVGFGGRILPGHESEREPKYLNSPESPVFNKRRLLFGLHQARKRGTAGKVPPLVVMEGYTDVLAANSVGVLGAVATLGTSLTPEHALLLQRFSDEEPVLLFDGDRAGRAAAVRAFRALAESMVPARIALLEEGLDPADLVREGGGDGLRRVLGRARPALDVWLELISMDCDMTRPEGRAEAAQQCRELLSGVRDPAGRRFLQKELASRLYLEERALEPRRLRLPQSFGAGDPGTGKHGLPDPEERARRCVLAALSLDPSLLPALEERWGADEEEFFPDPKLRTLLRDCREGLLDRAGTLEPGELWKSWWTRAAGDEGWKALLLDLQDFASTLTDPAQAASDGVVFLERKALRRATTRLKERIRRAHEQGDSRTARELERKLLAYCRRAAEA